MVVISSSGSVDVVVPPAPRGVLVVEHSCASRWGCLQVCAVSHVGRSLAPI